MPAFLTDKMLGRLTRWLRLAGYDVKFAGETAVEADNELLVIARKEKRVLVTRDNELYSQARKRGIDAIYVGKGDLVDRLVTITNKCQLEFEMTPETSRCPLCNALVEEVSKQTVEGKVPEKVYAYQDQFWRCKGCGQIYWKGTHWQHILATINEWRKRNV